VLTGAALMLTVVPRAQEIPLAPYEEVKPWGPSVAGEKPWEPAGVETDAQGRVVFLRRSDPSVWVLEPSGKVVRSFGEALFVWPHGIHIDRQGNIWGTDCAVGPSAGSQPQLQPLNAKAIAAKRGHLVYKFSPTGKILMTLGKAGQPGTGTDQFYCPSDVITASDGSIFVSDGHEGAFPNGRILKFTKDGKFIKTWGRKGKGPGEFASPHTMAWDSQGRLFVGDRSNGRIQIFDQEGNFLTQYTGFGGPSGIVITSDDTMYVCCANKSVYIGSARTGEVTGVIKDVWAEGIAADEQGNIYVGEVFRHVWRKFVPKK
jgi:DNA-binding beta-propeller fold protein YncE